VPALTGLRPFGHVGYAERAKLHPQVRPSGQPLHTVWREKTSSIRYPSVMNTDS